MKRQSTKWLLLIINVVFLATLCNCGPDKPPCIVKCETIKEAPSEAFEYLIFPDESWWEYELLDSNLVDTLTLDYTFKSYRDNQCEDGASGVCKYSYYVVYKHSNIEYFGEAPDHRDSREEFSINNFFGGETWYVQHSSQTMNVAPMEHFLNFPYYLGQRYNERMLTDTAFTLLYNGSNISCILTETTKNANQYGFRIMKFYMSKGIGIFRFEFYNGDIWQLKSHHINK